MWRKNFDLNLFENFLNFSMKFFSYIFKSYINLHLDYFCLVGKAPCDQNKFARHLISVSTSLVGYLIMWSPNIYFNIFYQLYLSQLFYCSNNYLSITWKYSLWLFFHFPMLGLAIWVCRHQWMSLRWERSLCSWRKHYFWHSGERVYCQRRPFWFWRPVNFKKEKLKKNLTKMYLCTLIFFSNFRKLRMKIEIYL